MEADRGANIYVTFTYYMHIYKAYEQDDETTEMLTLFPTFSN